MPNGFCVHDYLGSVFGFLAIGGGLTALLFLFFLLLFLLDKSAQLVLGSRSGPKHLSKGITLSVDTVQARAVWE
jgi:hypothetical protein